MPIFTGFGTYIQRRSKFCFVVLVVVVVLLLLLGVTVIAQNIALLSNFTMLSLFACVRCCLADRFKLVRHFAICNFILILIFNFDLISLFRPISTNFDQFRPELLISTFTGSLLLFPQFKDVAMLSLVYELISTCERG
jgi:glucose-6-phosphate-specific signal transduction histidine kinase